MDANVLDLVGGGVIASRGGIVAVYESVDLAAREVGVVLPIELVFEETMAEDLMGVKLPAIFSKRSKWD